MKRTLAMLLLLIPFTLLAQLRGKVVKISDGDTFTLLTDDKRQVKVRLHGIDCPESKQAYGKVAKQYTAELIFGKVVTVQETDVDRYGRTVGIVTAPGGKVVNEELLKAGLAWHYKKYDKNERWAELEQNAKEHQDGLWNDKDAVAPWSFRKITPARSGARQP